MASRTKNVSINMLVALACQLVNLLTTFVSRTVFIKTLGVDYLGVNGLFTNVLTILSFAELGIGNAMVFSMYKPLAAGDNEKLASLMKLYQKAYWVIGLTVAGVGLAVTPFLGFIIKDAPQIVEKIEVLYLLFLANSALSYFFVYKKSIIMADQKNYIVLAVTQAVHLAQITAQIIFLYVTHNFVVYLILQIVCTLITNVTCSVIADKMYPYLRGKAKPLPLQERKSIFSNIRSLAVYKFGSVILNGTDNILVSSMVGVTEVGLVSNYVLLNTSCNTILGKIVNGFTASVGNLNAVADRKKQYDVFKKMLFVTAWFYGFASVGLIVVAKPFITAWIGSEYLLNDLTPIAIVAGFYVQGMSFTAYTYRTTLGLFKQGRIAPLMAALLNIALSILLCKWIGLAGIFIATPVARLLSTGIVDPYLIYKKSFGCSSLWYHLRFFAYTAMFVGVGFLCQWLVDLVPIGGWAGAIIGALIVTVVFNGIMLLIFGRTKMFREIAASLLRMLKRKGKGGNTAPKPVTTYLTSNQKRGCVGCRACAEICPKGCITMQSDADGFVYPVIDKEKCIDCKLCEKACPVGYSAFAQKEDVKALVGIHHDESTVFSSSSGGAFTALYQTLVREGYSVFGVSFDEDLQVKHTVAKTEEECEKFRRSKYVLSDTNGSFEKVAALLKNGEKVLFTGTPCQCAALAGYLKVKNINRENLVLADLVCHGAPSQKIFDDYIADVEKKTGERVVAYAFRHKATEGRINSRTARLEYQSGNTSVSNMGDDMFLRGYYARLFYRPSCAVCQFARPERVSDLTLGDAWGIDQLYPEWNALKGVSLVIANTEKGKQLAQALGEQMTLREIDYQWAVDHNEQLKKPTTIHQNRAKFFELWHKIGFAAAVRKATKKPLYRRVLGKIKRILKK